MLKADVFQFFYKFGNLTDVLEKATIGELATELTMGAEGLLPLLLEKVAKLSCHDVKFRVIVDNNT